MDYPIAYGQDMLKLVLRMHAGAEKLPFYEHWIQGHMGGRVVTFRRKLMPHILSFTNLRDMDILDFGCGTGSTTVVLYERAVRGRITAIDIDRDSLEIANLRLRHHGIQNRITTHHIPPVSQVGDLDFALETFDFLLANGVLELLFISETPNLLWPIDRHTTGLPFIPWLSSRLAYKLAVACSRHTPGKDLDMQGRRGMSYWEIVRPLRRSGQPFEVLNITVAGNRLLPACPEPDAKVSAKRRLGSLLVERVAGNPLAALGIPTVAFGPFIEHLCLRKVPTQRS